MGYHPDDEFVGEESAQVDDFLARAREGDAADVDLVLPMRVDHQRGFEGRAVVAVPLETAVRERLGQDEKLVFHGALLAPGGPHVCPQKNPSDRRQRPHNGVRTIRFLDPVEVQPLQPGKEILEILGRLGVGDENRQHGRG